MKKCFLTLCFIGVLSGCQADKPSSCSDPETLSTLTRLLYENGVYFGGRPDIDADTLASLIKFEAPRAIRFDKEVNLYQCQTKAIVGNEITVDMEYESQLLEDGQSYISITTELLPGDLTTIGGALMRSYSKLQYEWGATKADTYEEDQE